VAGPNDGDLGADNSLTAIGGTQATGLWAVGWRESPSGLQPLVLRYDTTRPSPTWVSVSGAGGVPAPGVIDTVLTGIDVRSASDVWAVGYYFDGSTNRPLALHWDGSTWSNSPIPGTGLLRKVRAVGPGNVWAAGTYYNAGVQSYQTLVVHFDGTAWTTVVSADAPTADSEVIGLAADPAGSMLTAVGRQGPRPLVEQASCPTGPVSLPARAAAPVPPVAAAPGVGPAPKPPPATPPATTPIPVTITDQAAAAGISGPPDWTFSAAVADLNGDGWPDIFLARHWHPANLWLNNQNGTFSAADTAFFSSITDRHDCQAADFNQDGLPDLFCSVGADRGTGGRGLDRPHTAVPVLGEGRLNVCAVAIGADRGAAAGRGARHPVQVADRRARGWAWAGSRGTELAVRRFGHDRRTGSDGSPPARRRWKLWITSRTGAFV